MSHTIQQNLTMKSPDQLVQLGNNISARIAISKTLSHEVIDSLKWFNHYVIMVNLIYIRFVCVEGMVKG